MANDYGVRQGLLSKGYSNDDIGYDTNTGYVQVKGQNFMKPELNLSGTTYTSQQNFDNAYNQFAKSQRQMQPQATATQYAAPTQSPQATQSPYVDQYTHIIQDIQNRMNAPQQDVYSTPQYAAAQAQQQRAAQQGIRSAQEALGGAGFGRSTALGEAANHAQNQANEYLQLQMVPQIQQQLAAQRQAEIQNQMNTANMVYNLVNRQDTLDQNAFNNNIARSNATGYYTPDAAYIKDIQDRMAANSASYNSASPEEQQRLHQQNVALAAMIGGTDSTGNGDYVYSPIRTIQGQQLDLNQANADRTFGLTNTQTMAQLTGFMPDGTPTNAKQQQDLQNLWVVAQQTGTIPNQLADLYGIERGTKTQDAVQQAAQLAIARQNANTSAYSATASANNATARLAWDKSADNPDNMYKMTQINKANSEGSSTKVDPKDSADNFNTIIGDLGTDGVTKDQAIQLAQANRNYLTDSDYKKLLDEINKLF